LYTYVNGDGTLKPPGQLLLAASTRGPGKIMLKESMAHANN
jgi:hypothetical protein